MSEQAVVLLLDDDTSDHVTEALRKYLTWTRHIGQRVPAGVDLFYAGLRSAALDRQQPRLLDVPVQTLDGCLMPPRLLTYEAVAHQLSLSRRQVERLVACGDLPVLRIGGAARIRSSDLDAYIDHLDPQENAC